MDENTGTTRAFGKYLSSLFVSLFIATVTVLPFEESPEPGTLPILVFIMTFSAAFTLLFLWDAGYLRC